MKKILFIIIFLLLFCLLSFFFPLDYQLRISLKLPNFSAREIDLKIADEIQEALLNIFELKDFVIFSNQDECNIYCKYKFYYFLKKPTLKIENKILEVAKKYDNLIIEIDEDFDKKYTYLFLVSSEIADYKNLKKISDDFFKKMYLQKLKFKQFPLLKKDIIAQIKVDYSKLKNHDINITQLKDILLKSNIDKNSSYNFKKDKFFKADFEYKNEDDIKNLPIYYANKKNSLLLGDISYIKIKEKDNDSYIFTNNQNAYMVAIKPFGFFQKFLFKINFNKFKKDISNIYDVSLFDLAGLSRHEYIFDENESIDNILKVYQKIYKNNEIFLINVPFVNDKFYEKEGKKIIVLSKKYNKKSDKLKTICANDLASLDNKKQKYLLKHNNFYSFGLNKKIKIKYMPDLISMNEYKISRQEVMDSIFAFNDGIYCGFYYDESQDVSLYLLSDSSFIYSNFYKNFIPLSVFIKAELEEEFSQIARKKSQYCVFLKKSKNPL